MKIRRFIFPLVLGIFIAAGLSLIRPQVVHAQCGLPGTPPCEPSGGGGGVKRKKPTPIPPQPTSTPTVTSTIDPVYLTAIGCWEGIYRKTPAPELPTPSWNDIQGDAPECIATWTPSPTPTVMSTINPVYLTAIGCWEGIYRKTPAPQLPTPSWNDIQGDAPECLPTSTPTPTPSISIPMIAGPRHLLPGETVMIIMVLMGIVLIGSFILVIRRRLGRR